MADRPILFSAPMIQALLARTKTQTRRVIKGEIPPAPSMDAISPHNVARHPRPYLDAYCSAPKTDGNPRGMSRDWCWWTRDDRQGFPTFQVRYAPGDRLWVRETLAVVANWGVFYAASHPDETGFINERDERGWAILERWGDSYNASDRKRVPSIFMPRWASRLTLIVTDVRVQQLHEIDEADAIAEGASQYASSTKIHREFDPTLKGCYRAGFLSLWDEINGPGSTDANPWVAAYSFSVHRENIDRIAVQQMEPA